MYKRNQTSSRKTEWKRPLRVLARVALSGAGTAVALILTTSVAFASPAGSCYDPYNKITYPDSGVTDYWYTQVATQSAACTREGCPIVEDTEGGKGNLSTGGQPFNFDNSTQHVIEWITAQEETQHCTNGIRGAGCWVQVGWQVGHSEAACGGQFVNASSPEVYVEIYDDSSSPCFMSTFGSAPSNASYDARLYTTLSNGLHRYEVYFEVPGSGNIQVLAYGDFHDPNTAEIASGEAFVGTDGASCPVLGQTIADDWNYDGAPASQGTFASYMNLYQNGSWHTWTTSVAPTFKHVDPPYQLNPISNFVDDFSEWESGGPQPQ